MPGGDGGWFCPSIGTDSAQPGNCAYLGKIWAFAVCHFNPKSGHDVLAVAHLTVSHAQLLLAVPAEGLCARRVASIAAYHPRHLPADSVGGKDSARLMIAAVLPKQDKQYKTWFSLADIRNKLLLKRQIARAQLKPGFQRLAAVKLNRCAADAYKVAQSAATRDIEVN